MKALIIVDMQYDFLPGGSLAVPEGDKIVQTINKLQAEYDIIVATQDWHPNNHNSFVTAHPGSQPFSIKSNKRERSGFMAGALRAVDQRIRVDTDTRSGKNRQNL
jgi:nicotinamidase-related amidase